MYILIHVVFKIFINTDDDIDNRNSILYH